MRFKEIINKYEAEDIYTFLLEEYPNLKHKSHEIQEFISNVVGISKRAIVIETILHVEKENDEYNVFFTKYRNNTHCYILEYLKEEELVNSKIIQEEVDKVGELEFIAHIFNFLIENDEDWLSPAKDEKYLRVEDILKSLGNE